MARLEAVKGEPDYCDSYDVDDFIEGLAWLARAMAIGAAVTAAAIYGIIRLVRGG